MSTNIDYVLFVCEQIPNYYEIRYKKMFGEYMVYVNEKPILLICDNLVYVKKLPQVAELMEQADCGIPYKGAKEHYILDFENTQLVENVVSILEKITPLPKRKIQ